MVVPLQRRGAKSTQRAIEMRRSRDDQVLLPAEQLEVILGTAEVRFIGVTIPTGADIRGDADISDRTLAVRDGLGLIEGVEQNLEVLRHVLTSLVQHVEYVRIHPVIRIAHGLRPQRFSLRRQLPRCPLVAMNAREVIHQIAKLVDDSTGVFFSEAPEGPVRSPAVISEDRLEMRRLLLGQFELLGSECADPNHAYIAVAPGLTNDPLDQIIAIPFARTPAVRFVHSSRRSDDVHITPRHKEARVAGLHMTNPQSRPGWLRRKFLRDLRALNVLAVAAECQ